MNDQLNANRLTAVVVAMSGLYLVLSEVLTVLNTVLSLLAVYGLAGGESAQGASAAQSVFGGSLWVWLLHLVLQFVLGYLLVALRDPIAQALFPVGAAPAREAATP